MAQVLVRQLGNKVVVRLKRRVKEHSRSLQSEVKTILEQAVRTMRRPGNESRVSQVIGKVRPDIQ